MILFNCKIPRRQPAMWFDGVNDWVNCGTNTNLHFTGDFSLAVRVKVPAGGAYPAYVIRRGNYGIYYNEGRFSFDTRKADLSWDSLYTPYFYAFGQAYYVVCTFAVATAAKRIYLNGGLQNNNTATALPASAGATFSIGCNSGANLWHQGMIRQVWAFNRVISDEEIATLARGDTVSNAIGHWHGAGILDADWTNLANDFAHGTANGSPEADCMVHRRGWVIRTSGGVRSVAA